MLLFPLLVTTLLGTGASTGLGAEPEDAPPILDDLERARAFGPPAGTLGPEVRQTLGDEAAEVDPARPFVRIVGHSRWAIIPKFMFGLAFEESTDLSSASAGVAIEFGDLDESVWAVELDWTSLTPRAGNWNNFFSDPADAFYLESTLQMFSVDLSYRNNLPIASWFRAVFGGGLGVGYLSGDLETADVLPTCTDPVSACAHWPRATTSKVELPTRIIPVLHFTGGLEVDIGPVTVRAEAGFRDVLYTGLSLGFFL
jgi:hypothetical protein